LPLAHCVRLLLYINSHNFSDVTHNSLQIIIINTKSRKNRRKNVANADAACVVIAAIDVVVVSGIVAGFVVASGQQSNQSKCAPDPEPMRRFISAP